MQANKIDIETHIGQFNVAIVATAKADKQNEVNGIALYHLTVHDTASAAFKDVEGKRKTLEFNDETAGKVEATGRKTLGLLFDIESYTVTKYVSKTKPAPSLAEQLAGLGYNADQIAEIVKGAKPEAQTPVSPEITSES